MPILVTGAGGLLGGRLTEVLSLSFDVVAAHHNSPPPYGTTAVPMDLASVPAIEKALDRARPDAVVHCAALADADRCEREPDMAIRLNVVAAETLARLCCRRSIRLIALSTDLVFAGDRSWVSEQVPPAPLQTYARTKLLGEQAVMAEAPGSVILRVALVCGRGYGLRPSASESIVWGLRAGRALKLFTDQYRTPIDPESVAAAVAHLVSGSQTGCFHLGGPERLSRYQLGVRVASVLSLPIDGITGVTQAEGGLGALRPADVSLDSSRARRELGWEPRSLEQAIREGRSAPDIIAKRST